jgi:Sec-independent protein translocase protein TatA
MSMTGLLFLGLLGLVIFGPKKLVTLGEQAGQTLGRLKKMSGDFQSQLEVEVSATESGGPIEQASTVTRSEK